MSSSSSPSRRISCDLHSKPSRGLGTLRIRLSYWIRIVSRSQTAISVLYEFPSAPMANNLFQFPLSRFQNESLCQLFVARVLCCFNLSPNVCSRLASTITAFAFRVAANYQMYNHFDIAATIRYIETYDMIPEDETPESVSDIQRLLEKVQISADSSEDCSICFEALTSKNEAVELACKHLYHEQCIIKWLQINRSCPLCRRLWED